jgi:hypothetical protein
VIRRFAFCARALSPHHQYAAMPDILYILTTVAFFGLMIAFIWACEKI